MHIKKTFSLPDQVCEICEVLAKTCILLKDILRFYMLWKILRLSTMIFAAAWLSSDIRKDIAVSAEGGNPYGGVVNKLYMVNVAACLWINGHRTSTLGQWRMGIVSPWAVIRIGGSGSQHDCRMDKSRRLCNGYRNIGSSVFIREGGYKAVITKAGIPLMILVPGNRYRLYLYRRRHTGVLLSAKWSFFPDSRRRKEMRNRQRWLPVNRRLSRLMMPFLPIHWKKKKKSAKQGNEREDKSTTVIIPIK